MYRQLIVHSQRESKFELFYLQLLYPIQIQQFVFGIIDSFRFSQKERRMDDDEHSTASESDNGGDESVAGEETY